MKKILIVANKDITLLYFRMELIKKLLIDGNEVTVTFPKSNAIEEFTKIGCKYIPLDIERRGKNPLKDFKVMLECLKIIKKEKPDAVLTYTIKPNIYGGIAARIKKVPYIVNITGLGTALENEGLLQKLTIFLYKIALKKVKCCFVQNTENLEFMKKNIGKNIPYKLIPGSGVNLEKYKVLDYPKEDDKIRFLFISRIMKEKGIEQYLETAEYITKKYTNTEFHILGFCEQEYEERLKNLQDKKIITYHGRQDNIIPFLEKASCLVHPSYYPEGMSNVLLEASASERPVITTNRSGCREIVDDGKTGFIIQIKNTEQLIEKVEQFIKMPNEEKKKMGLAARKKVEKEFDRNIVIEAYINEINSIHL